MSGHCVSSWSDHMISCAIKSTIPADAADVDPRQYTSWLGERSPANSGVPATAPGDVMYTSSHFVISDSCIRTYICYGISYFYTSLGQNYHPPVLTSPLLSALLSRLLCEERWIYPAMLAPLLPPYLPATLLFLIKEFRTTPLNGPQSPLIFIFIVTKFWKEVVILLSAI